MKKTIFILTLLLPFGFLFAQPESEVEQIGVNNSVVVTQNGDLNYSWVYTVGDDNTPSFVNQEGHGVNDSYVDQTFLGLVYGNSANVHQENDFLEPGDDNYSNIDQEGNYNAANVTQIAEESLNGVARNSNIYQYGDWNTATVHQEGRMIDAIINQSGDENTSNVLQEGNKLEADIDQTGWHNTSEVEQEGYRQTAEVDQGGGWSEANIYQGKGKYVSVPTESRLNEAKINQTGFSWGSLAEQTQDGKQNYANIEQNASDFGKAIQIQVNEKTHNVGSRWHDVNVADILQSNGLNNKAYQLQHYSVGGTTPNYANVVQDGNDNYSLETQWGGGNSSNVIQLGDDNHSDVTQNKHSITPPDYTGLLPTGF